MYFISSLLLSGALVAAQDADESVPTPKSVNDALAVSTTPLESITTVFVTVTRTLCPATSYPMPSYPPPTAQPSSHFTFPPSVTHEVQPGEQPSFAYETTKFLAGPIYQYTSLAPAKMHTASFAKYSGNAYVTGQRQFTFATSLVASTTTPFEGHYTPITSLATKSICNHWSMVTALSTSFAVSTPSYPSPTRSNPGYDLSPSSALYTATSQSHAEPTRSGTGYASLPAQPTVPDETMDVMPIPTPTEADSSMLPLPDAEDTMDILPLPKDEPARKSPPSHSPSCPPAPSLPFSALPDSTVTGFTWPTTSLDINIKTSITSDDTQSEAIDDATAWSGADAAIPAQMHNRARQARTLPWLSPPPPLHSSSAAGRRMGRVWPDVFKRRSDVGASKDSTNGLIEESGGVWLGKEGL